MTTGNLSKNEAIKTESKGLRGTISEELSSDSKKFGRVDEELLKFHGIYQQKDRDRLTPDQKKAGVAPKPFALMIRGRIPGGRMTAKQWGQWDQLSDKYSIGSLRLTTRQSVQLHGVLKQNLKSTVNEINQALSSTTGACGDVVRNVNQAVNPWGSRELSKLDEVTNQISDRYIVKSKGYLEIFIDGELQDKEDSSEEETIYGKTYLPRKFKIAVTAEGNNSVDLYTHDLAVAATFDDNSNILGYHVFAGGGMGNSHNDDTTFPRLADRLGWIEKDKLFAVTDAVITTQRDHGNREKRTRARLKYLIHDKGVEWFKKEVESRASLSFEDRKLPEWNTPSYLGWSKNENGTWSLGFHILSGRIIDTPARPLKSSIRDILSKYNLDIQVTAEQDLVLLGIKESDKEKVISFFKEQGIDTESPTKLFDRAMTCVALPMCIKALSEAERIGADLFGSIQTVVDRYELNHKAPIIRVTGCPNGCARPYAAEIGFVGKLPNKYVFYIGGNEEGTRLAEVVLDIVPYNEITDVLDRLFSYWSKESKVDERLGDFYFRVGKEAVLAKIAEK